MPTPSLILVPARFKTGKLYTPVATTSGGTVLGASGDFNVTRATNATRVNASGLIESVASGIPRLDYLGSSCPALLVEPSAQNLALYSETWASGNNWNLTNNVTTVTGTMDTLDPLGTNTANAISPTAVSGSHFLYSNSPANVLYTSGTIYTQTAFFKQGTGAAGRYVQLSFSVSRFTQDGYANFDLQLGEVTVVTGSSADSNRAASIESYGNGWYRCRFTATCDNGGTGVGVIPILITASGDIRIPSFTGVTGDVLYGWGAQVETGSIATSYIPTTTAAVTRNADVISVTGAVSGCIGQTEGTVYVEVDIRNLTAGARIPVYFLSALGSPTDSVRIQFMDTNQWRGYIRANSVNVFSVAGPTSQPQGIYKIAFGYKSGDSVLYINGTQADTDSSSFTFNAALVIAAMHGTSEGNNIMNDRIRAAAIYTTRLTNAELAALTTL